MKNILVILASVVICFLSGCSNTKDMFSIGTIEKGFREIPDSIRVGCYWYWISDNISKEGVIKDLHAMKKAGITRAYIGNNIKTPKLNNITICKLDVCKITCFNRETNKEQKRELK